MNNLRFFTLLFLGLFYICQLNAQEENFLDLQVFSFEDGGSTIFYQQTSNYWSVSSDRSAGDGNYSLKFSSTEPILSTQKAKASDLNIPAGDYTFKVKVWLAADAVINGFAFNIKTPWKAIPIGIDTVSREEWVEISIPITLDSDVTGAGCIIRIDSAHIGNGTMYLDDFGLWGEKEPDPLVLPLISSIETTDSANLNLSSGVYDVKMKLWKDPGTTITKLYSTISEPWHYIEWDIDTVSDGRWTELQKELIISDTVENATLALEVNNNPEYGGGNGALYIDDIEFVRTEDYFEVSGLSMSESEITLLKNETYILGYDIQPSNASNKSVLWLSSNSGIASVTQEGLVAARAKGETSISVFSSDGGFVTRCKVIVRVPVEGISLSHSELSLEVGEEFLLSDTIKPLDASNTEVEWTSDNESVASVSEGLVNGLSEGIAVISVTTQEGAFIAQCQVTVKIAVEGVTLSDSEITIDMGEKYQLSHAVNPVDATNQDVKWSSDAEAVASVSNGQVSGLSAGAAMITVTTVEGPFSAACQVTVLDTSTSVYNIEADDLEIWPNPFTSELYIEAGENNKSMELYSISGVLLLNKILRGPSMISLAPPYEQVPPGMYIIKLRGGKTCKTARIVRK